MSSEQDNTIARQRLLMELNEKLLKQKKDLDAQLEELTIEKEHIESEKKKIEEKNNKLWEQSMAIHKEKERIDFLKQEVETRHKEVMDSISYAKRIQNAILPLDSEMESSLPESFVFYKPKDIVSGDFYWMGKINSKNQISNSERQSELSNLKSDMTIIAAVDCTGHGVPGAFMSMIGNILLEEIVIQKGFTDPGKILEQLDNNVRMVLRQDNNETSTRDGMDVCLCVIDEEHKTVKYAGANRPIWIVKNSNNLSNSNTHETVSAYLLDEIKATKAAIGGLRDEPVQFKTHEIPFEKGDRFYLTTDGYADQFSPQDKKMMTKRFKEKIVAVSSKSMSEQRVDIKDYFMKWKGDMEQTDDILIIGIKL
jgi:serine phosphatase RsbU (regulator of sigma subunit)